MALFCLFFDMSVLFWCLCQHVSIGRAIFPQIFGFTAFSCAASKCILELPSAELLKNGRDARSLSWWKIKPVTTLKMAFYLVAVIIICKKKYVLIDSTRFKAQKMTIFHVPFNTVKNRQYNWWCAPSELRPLTLYDSVVHSNYFSECKSD